MKTPEEAAPQGAWFDPAMDLPIDVTHWRPIELLKTQEYEKGDSI